MSQDFLYKAILGSIVSEKSTRIGEKNNQYIFRVVPEATTALSTIVDHKPLLIFSSS